MRCGSDSGTRRVVFREDPEVLACAPRWARATDDFGPRGISTKPARTKGFVGGWSAAFIMISRIYLHFRINRACKSVWAVTRADQNVFSERTIFSCKDLINYYELAITTEKFYGFIRRILAPEKKRCRHASGTRFPRAKNIRNARTVSGNKMHLFSTCVGRALIPFSTLLPNTSPTRQS